MEAGLPAAFLSIPHTGSRFSFRRSARADPRPQQGPDVNARCARWAAGPGAARYRPRSVRSSGALAPDTPAEGQLAPRTPWQAESWSAVAGFDGGERGALPWWGWKLCRPVLDERLPAPLGQPWWDGRHGAPEVAGATGHRRSLAPRGEVAGATGHRRSLGGRWRDGASEVAGAPRGTGGRWRHGAPEVAGATGHRRSRTICEVDGRRGATRGRWRSLRSSGALAPDTPAEGQPAPRTPWQAESWSAVARFDGGKRGALPWWGWKLCRPVLDERLPAPLGQPWWDGELGVGRSSAQLRTGSTAMIFGGRLAASADGTRPAASCRVLRGPGVSLRAPRPRRAARSHYLRRVTSRRTAEATGFDSL